MISKTLISIFSILYIFVLPINYLLSDKPHWIFHLVAICIYIFLWIFPLYFLYKKKKLNLSKIIILILLNTFIWSITLYFWEIHSEQLREEIIQLRNKTMQDYTNKGLIEPK